MTLAAPQAAPAWRAHGVLAAALFVFLVCELLPIGAQSEMARGLSASPAQVGLLLTAYAVVAGVLTLPMVRLGARLDQRTALVGAMLLLAVAQLGLATAGDLTSAALWRALAAASHGLVWSQAPVVAVRLAPPGQAGRATANVLLGASAALVAGAPLASGAASLVGWRPTAAALGLAALASALLLRALLPPLPPLSRRSPDAQVPTTAHATPFWRPVLVVSFGTIVVVTGHYVAYGYLEPLIAHAGLSPALVPLLAAYGCAGLVGVRVAGAGFDAHPGVTLVAVPGLLALGLAALALPGVAAFVPALLLWGAAAGAVPVVLNATVIAVGADRADLASGVYVTAYQVGIATGAAVGSAVLAAVGVGVLPVVAALVCAAAAALLAATTRGRAGERPPGPPSGRTA